MYLKISHDIESNVFSTVITIDSYGTEKLSEYEERELLKGFPTKIAYRSLEFKKNVKTQDGAPVVTPAEPNGSSVVEVALPTLSGREILLGDGFEAAYRVDASRISPSAIDGKVITTREQAAQAYCVVFDEVIRGAVDAAMKSVRGKAPLFAGETVVSV